MKHIGPSGLDELDAPGGLLPQLRAVEGLTEKKRGVFYRRSHAFLHFHEDPSGLYADVRLVGDGFDRCRVSTPGEQRALVEAVRAALRGETRH